MSLYFTEKLYVRTLARNIKLFSSRYEKDETLDNIIGNDVIPVIKTLYQTHFNNSMHKLPSLKQTFHNR